MTGELDGDGDDPHADRVVLRDHEDAWWFDRNHARRLITSLGYRDQFGRDLDLPITAVGRYVVRCTSRAVNEPATCWVAVTAEQAGRWFDQASDADRALGMAMGASLPTAAIYPADQHA